MAVEWSCRMTAERTLSRSSQPGDRGPAPARPAHQLLVVDDDPSAREAMRLVLQTAGHALHVVETAGEAAAVAREEPIELALVDLRLGEASGIDLLVGSKEDSPGDVGDDRHRPRDDRDGGRGDAPRRRQLPGEAGGAEEPAGPPGEGARDPLAPPPGGPVRAARVEPRGRGDPRRFAGSAGPRAGRTGRGADTTVLLFPARPAPARGWSPGGSTTGSSARRRPSSR